jgi:hypothetical protein
LAEVWQRATTAGRSFALVEKTNDHHMEFGATVCSSTSGASRLDFDMSARTMTPAPCGRKSDGGKHEQRRLGSSQMLEDSLSVGELLSHETSGGKHGKTRGSEHGKTSVLEFLGFHLEEELSRALR